MANDPNTVAQTAGIVLDDQQAAGEPEPGIAPRCLTCSRWEQLKEKVKVANLVAKAAEHFESKFRDETYKPTVAEYLKLLQFEKDIEDESQDKEVTATWVNPENTSAGK